VGRQATHVEDTRQDHADEAAALAYDPAFQRQVRDLAEWLGQTPRSLLYECNPAVAIQELRQYPDGKDVTTDELGCRALPREATPAQRAAAEASWAPVAADRPCRCSGRCSHDKPCPTDEAPCGGRLIHTRRQPSLIDPEFWHDEHTCATCLATFDNGVRLPEIALALVEEHHR
jgi:hypothetical protein